MDNSSRPRLLMLAYLCRPDAGSEAGASWNWAVQNSKRFDTWVLCDEHLNGASIRSYLDRHGPLKGLQFAFVPTSRWEHVVRRLPGICYLGYNLWHRRAFRIARELHQRHLFDLTHQVSLLTFREPGYLWKLDAPLIWGPLGGTQVYPWRCLGEAGLYGALYEGFRNLITILQLRFGWRVRRAAARSARLLAASSTNQRDLSHVCGQTPERMIDVGIRSWSALPRDYAQRCGPLRILWSGNLRQHKALSLLIKALALLPDDVPYELRILGKGPFQDRWQRLARRLGVEAHTTWMGFLPHAEAMSQYDWADLFVFTSLRDTSGNVLVEALADGLPVVCLDHQGAGDIVTDRCGVKIPVTTPAEIARQLSQEIASLARDRERLTSFSHGAVEHASSFSWDDKGATMAAIYRRALEDAGNRPKNAARAFSMVGRLLSTLSTGELAGVDVIPWI